MTLLHRLDPCQDPRWRRFLERHPDASVFHTPEWLTALRSTYGYEPIAYTTSSPESDLSNGQVFCYIKSWLTGTRLVSLPFSDHAGLLAEHSTKLHELLIAMRFEQEKLSCRYLEIRPTHELIGSGEFVPSGAYSWHRLALDRDLDDLFTHFHPSCVQRKIRRAEQEQLQCSIGRSEDLLQQFYRLLVMTHKRHRVPPQPMSWFRNLIRSLGRMITIRIASKDGRPIAGIITLSYKRSIVYKYGGSDARYHKLGGMPLLLWNTIGEAKNSGCEEFDLGRSENDNVGLIKFKEHWGARRHKLVYWRRQQKPLSSVRGWESKTARKVLKVIPAAILPGAGRLLYRHIG